MKLLVGSLLLLLLIVDAQHAVDKLSAEDGNMNETISLNDTTIAKQKYKKWGIGGAIVGGLVSSAVEAVGGALFG
ncbi:hypothetical protein Aduo_016637 [Ancylostoma duodenale]